MDEKILQDEIINDDELDSVSGGSAIGTIALTVLPAVVSPIIEKITGDSKPKDAVPNRDLNAFKLPDDFFLTYSPRLKAGDSAIINLCFC